MYTQRRLLPLRQLRQQAIEAGAVAVLLSQFTQVVYDTYVGICLRCMTDMMYT